MAIVNSYTNLDVVKARAGIADVADDAILETAVITVSRMIDDYCGRRFYTTDDVDEVRALRAPENAMLARPRARLPVRETRGRR